MKKLISKIFDKFNSQEEIKVEIDISENWIKYDNGNSIGKKGSEGGKIVNDQENLNGARITLESNIGKIPLAVTFGIYGLIFHTEFFSETEIAVEYFKRKKDEISHILQMFEISEDDQDAEWENKKNEYLEKLICE